jgi:hypothetical protein
MTYWRMQLHPPQSARAAQRAAESLSAGFIGLDFRQEVGDLTKASRADLGDQPDYRAFAHEMAEDDLVLVIAHHFPFALVTVAGPYNYIRAQAPELGVWFRHFRRVSGVHYYADLVTNAVQWERLVMTDTISPLRDVNSSSYRLIKRWRSEA